MLSGGISIDHATQGHQVEVIISQSPFYAEGGGQLGDRGSISGPNGVVAVEDTQSPVAGLIVQRGTVSQGEISVGDAITAEVESVLLSPSDASDDPVRVHLCGPRLLKNKREAATRRK